MLHVNSSRITDPKRLSAQEIVDACRQHERLVVQFSRPDVYSPTILQNLNEACRLIESHVQVRFFGHYQTGFNASALRHLSEVRDLAVDCLSKIENEEEIGKLPKLTRLSLGVFEMDRPDILETIDLHKLERLALTENRKRNIDLSPLSRCKSLEDLLVNGHSKGIEVVAGLLSLHKLTLSAYAKSNRLDFISDIPRLREFILILGGRSDINDLLSDSLATLQIIRVRGLTTVGDLSRLPSLVALRIEDQLQLAELDLRGADLERLSLFNCKNLAAISGLDTQGHLREFTVSRVALDLDALRDRDWPETATSINLFSGSRKWNDDARAHLVSRGLGEKGSLWL